MTNFRKCRPWIAATTARRTLLFLLAVVSALPALCQSENQHRPRALVWQQSSPQSPQQRRQEQDEELSTIQKENARRANEQRQLELRRDTDKLLQLTNELK
jgi:Integrin alpha